MKQGIVMEVKKRKAYVLTKEGTFERVTLKNGQLVEIGTEIDVPAAKNFLGFHSQRAVLSFIAAAAVLLVLITQFPFFNQSNLAVAAYVGVDINPSLEVGVDELLNVVEVIPINKDGQLIVDQIQETFRNQTLSEFIAHAMELAKKDGFLKENNDVLLTTTTINKNAEASLEENVNKIKKEIESNGVVVTTLKGDENTRKEAKDLGLSTGKYLIYKKSESSLTIEETKDLSISQIYEKLDQKGKNNKSIKEKTDQEKNKAEKFENKNDNNAKKVNEVDKAQKMTEKQNDQKEKSWQNKEAEKKLKEAKKEFSSKNIKQEFNKGHDKEKEKKAKNYKEKDYKDRDSSQDYQDHKENNKDWKKEDNQWQGNHKNNEFDRYDAKNNDK